MKTIKEDYFTYQTQDFPADQVLMQIKDNIDMGNTILKIEKFEVSASRKRQTITCSIIFKTPVVDSDPIHPDRDTSWFDEQVKKARKQYEEALANLCLSGEPYSYKDALTDIGRYMLTAKPTSLSGVSKFIATTIYHKLSASQRHYLSVKLENDFLYNIGSTLCGKDWLNDLIEMTFIIAALDVINHCNKSVQAEKSHKQFSWDVVTCFRNPFLLMYDGQYFDLNAYLKFENHNGIPKAVSTL